MKFQFRTHVGLYAAPGEPLTLYLEDGSRGLDHRFAAFVLQIAHHQGGLGQPGNEAQRVEVGHGNQIAISLFPTGHLKPWLGIHFHAGREKVVTTVKVFAIEKVDSGEPFANQAAVMVGENRQDGVDLSLIDQPFEFIHP